MPPCGRCRYTPRMPTLYIVATPIGNLSDASARSIEVLGSVDGILAEDTRRTRKLLVRFDLSIELCFELRGSTHAADQTAVGGRALEKFGHTHTLAGISEPGAHSWSGVRRR